jgi:hypothetical protein
MRPVALGRKNWIHIGSPHAGPKIAAILSLVEKLPSAEGLRAQIPGGDPSRPSRCQDPTAISAHSLCVDHHCLTRPVFEHASYVREAGHGK